MLGREKEMALPDSWTNKPNAIKGYLEAIRQAEPPERFSIKFLDNLGFKSTNDRKFISILKSLGFLDADGKPTDRYYEYLDLSQSEAVLAEAIREAFGDLFAINKEAQKFDTDQVTNKLKTLYAGAKKTSVIGYIANTFTALVGCADFEAADVKGKPTPPKKPSEDDPKEKKKLPLEQRPSVGEKLTVDGLQYHINIALPESRDQAVYDAIFKALRDHLG